jgi:hypothetical protein
LVEQLFDVRRKRFGRFVVNRPHGETGHTSATANFGHGVSFHIDGRRAGFFEERLFFFGRLNDVIGG